MTQVVTTGSVDWAAVGRDTAIGAVTGAVTAALPGANVVGGGAARATNTSRGVRTTRVYRSVSPSEANSIRATGQFRLSPGGMESKQFGLSLRETRNFGTRVGQNQVVRARVPNNMLRQLDRTRVDTTWFRRGTVTVHRNQLNAFNEAVSRTIRFLR